MQARTMTRDDQIKLTVATIIDEAVGAKKKPRRRPKTTYPPPRSGTRRRFIIQGDTKNIPIERSYIWLTIDVKAIALAGPKSRLWR